MRVRLRELFGDDDKAMFDVSRGILGAFMPKVRMAHALGLIDRPTFDGLNRTFTPQASEALNSGILMGDRPAGDACDYLGNPAGRLKN